MQNRIVNLLETSGVIYQEDALGTFTPLLFNSSMLVEADLFTEAGQIETVADGIFCNPQYNDKVKKPYLSVFSNEPINPTLNNTLFANLTISNKSVFVLWLSAPALFQRIQGNAVFNNEKWNIGFKIEKETVSVYSWDDNTLVGQQTYSISSRIPESNLSFVIDFQKGSFFGSFLKEIYSIDYFKRSSPFHLHLVLYDQPAIIHALAVGNNKGALQIQNKCFQRTPLLNATSKSRLVKNEGDNQTYVLETEILERVFSLVSL